MEIEIGKIYRHFKGNLYEVKAIATHTETGEKMVVYEACYGDGECFVRPYDSFVSRVDKGKYPEAKQAYRFELYKPEDVVPVHPLVLSFLDTDDFHDRYGILKELQPIITDDMINIMASSMDLTIDEDLSTNERFLQLQNCVDLRRQFESNRLR